MNEEQSQTFTWTGKQHRYEVTLFEIKGKNESCAAISLCSNTKPSLRLRLIAWLTGGRTIKHC